MDPAILFVSFESVSKIRLVSWPAFLETRVSRLPTTRYAGQPIAIGSQAACRLHAPLFCICYTVTVCNAERKPEQWQRRRDVSASSSPSNQHHEQRQQQHYERRFAVGAASSPAAAQSHQPLHPRTETGHHGQRSRRSLPTVSSSRYTFFRYKKRSPQWLVGSLTAHIERERRSSPFLGLEPAASLHSSLAARSTR